jgi:hypothetical protein
MSQSAIQVEPPAERRMSLDEWAAMPEDEPGERIVDPRLRTVEILKLGEEGHYTTLVSASEGVVAVPGCEGLVLELDALWMRLDEIVEDEPDEEPG